MEMKCNGIKKSGERCTNNRKNGEFCAVHSKVKKMGRTISITFGDRVENHAGMEIHGTTADKTFTTSDLKLIHQKLGGEYINLSCLNLIGDHIGQTLPEACLLIIPRFIQDHLKINISDFRKEHFDLEYDKKAIFRGVVKNKVARHNVCFGPEAQQADIPNGKGTIVPFSDVPILNEIRDRLPDFFGETSRNLLAESNDYYDISKCTIGFHGDTERTIVICIRLGASFPITFKWFKNNEIVSESITRILNEGDLYIMSDYAIGTNWKKRSIYTLRHAAGLKYI